MFLSKCVVKCVFFKPVGIPEANNASSEDDEIDALVAERTAAKKNKDYKTADAIRERLAGMGITLEDTPQGTRWKRN